MTLPVEALYAGGQGYHWRENFLDEQRDFLDEHSDAGFEVSSKGFPRDCLHIAEPRGLWRCGNTGAVENGVQQYDNGCGEVFVSEVCLADHQKNCPERTKQ